VGSYRRYIFTDRERRLLEEWIETREETGSIQNTTKDSFSWAGKSLRNRAGLARGVRARLGVLGGLLSFIGGKGSYHENPRERLLLATSYSHV